MACEGGNKTTVRARGSGAVLWKANNVCRLGPRPPRAGSTLFFHGLCVSAESPQLLASGVAAANTEIASPKPLSMFIDAGAVRLGAPIMLRAVVKAGSS